MCKLWRGISAELLITKPQHRGRRDRLQSEQAPGSCAATAWHRTPPQYNVHPNDLYNKAEQQNIIRTSSCLVFRLIDWKVAGWAGPGRVYAVHPYRSQKWVSLHILYISNLQLLSFSCPHHQHHPSKNASQWILWHLGAWRGRELRR